MLSVQLSSSLHFLFLQPPSPAEQDDLDSPDPWEALREVLATCWTQLLCHLIHYSPEPPSQGDSTDRCSNRVGHGSVSAGDPV